MEMPFAAFTNISKHFQNKISAGVSLISCLHRSIILNKVIHNLFQFPNTGLREMLLHHKKAFSLQPKLDWCSFLFSKQLYEK